jgi:hypothetical protein
MSIKLFLRGQKTYFFDAPGDFDTEDLGYAVYLTGTLNWGMAPLHRITQRGPFQNGDTDVDFRLDPRIINLPFVAIASTVTESFDVREKLLQVFTPGNDIAQFSFGWRDNEFRKINVTVAGGLTMDTDAKDFNVRGVIQLRAADPTWYDFNETFLTLTSTLFGTATPYPKPYPVPYGSDTINKITTINYTGSWPTYPRIQVTGPATNLTIVDGLGNIILFDTVIPAAEIWTIDLSYGAKSVIDQNGVNRFSSLNINSDIINWGIFPNPTVFNGVNTISVSATSTTNATQVYMYYSARYIGV